MKIKIYVLNKREGAYYFKESITSYKDTLILKLIEMYSPITGGCILTKREYGKFCKIRKITS